MSKISIVILNYLNYEDTIECVKSLLVIPQIWNYVGGVVIVDNHSSNESYEILSNIYAQIHKIEIVRTEENLGFAKGNNVGIRIARNKFRTDFVLCVNNDTIFQGGTVFFELLVNKYLQAPDKIAVLGPAIQLNDGTTQNICTSALGVTGVIFYYIQLLLDYLHLHNSNLFHIMYLASKKQQVQILHGCCLLFTPPFFKYYDGFYPKTFLYAEEQILYLMCKYVGIYESYVPECSIYHKEDQSSEMSFQNDKHIDIKYNLQSYKYVVYWAIKNALKKSLKGKT